VVVTVAAAAAAAAAVDAAEVTFVMRLSFSLLLKC